MKVLINRTDAIGDTLLSTPVARLLKEKFPESHITFLVSPRSGELIKLFSGVDNVIVYNSKNSFIKRFKFLLRLFKEEEFSHFFHLGGVFLPCFLAFILKVPFRGGLVSKFSSFLWLNKGVRQSRSMVTQHESDYNLNLLAPLGVHYSFKKRQSYAPVLNIDKSLAESYLSDIPEIGDKSRGALIFIHPGMSGHTLNWSSRNYGRLIERLITKTKGPLRIVVSYTPSDEPYLRGIRDYLKDKGDLEKHIFFFNGAEKGLIHFVHVLSQAEVFVGPSTGTTHIANALSIPQVAIYSPIKVQSALRWGPYLTSPKTHVVVPDVVCGEVKQCAGASCPYYECMAKIEVDDIFEATVKVSGLDLV
jgi:heptosyltransferase-3